MANVPAPTANGGEDPVEVPAAPPAKRRKATLHWEYIVLRESPTKDKLDADEWARVVHIDPVHWIAAGDKTSINMTALQKKEETTAWIHFDYHSRRNFTVLESHGPFILLGNTSKKHQPVVCRAPAMKVFTVQASLCVEHSLRHKFEVDVYNLAGNEVYGGRLDCSMETWRFKETFLSRLDGPGMTSLDKKQCQLVNMNGKQMPGGQATLRTWFSELFQVGAAKNAVVLSDVDLSNAGA